MIPVREWRGEDGKAYEGSVAPSPSTRIASGGGRGARLLLFDVHYPDYELLGKLDEDGLRKNLSRALVHRIDVERHHNRVARDLGYLQKWARDCQEQNENLKISNRDLRARIGELDRLASEKGFAAEPAWWHLLWIAALASISIGMAS